MIKGKYVLNNGKVIPKIGFGTLMLPEDRVVALVKDAIESGWIALLNKRLLPQNDEKIQKEGTIMAGGRDEHGQRCGLHDYQPCNEDHQPRRNEDCAGVEAIHLVHPVYYGFRMGHRDDC